MEANAGTRKDYGRSRTSLKPAPKAAGSPSKRGFWCLPAPKFSSNAHWLLLENFGFKKEFFIFA